MPVSAGFEPLNSGLWVNCSTAAGKLTVEFEKRTVAFSVIPLSAERIFLKHNKIDYLRKKIVRDGCYKTFFRDAIAALMN